VIRLRETTVDDETDAVGLDRRFALVGSDRYVSVDDMRIVLVQTEFPQDGLANLLLVSELEECALLLLVEFLGTDKVALESGHLVLVEER